MNSKRPPKKIRLDDLLVAQGLADDKTQALRKILAHEVRIGDEYATSAAWLVSPDASVVVKQEKPFVSRGGQKLQGALDAFNQSVGGLRCIDIGSSTGGFSDCLLQAGAAQVTCVDVNYGQLAWEVRQDPRVRVFERTNIRTADPVALGAPFDLIVADLSFIGLASLAPVFATLCHGYCGQDTANISASDNSRHSIFIGLIKPQFESRHEETDHGVVRSDEVRQRTVAEVRSALEAAGFEVTGVVESPLKGPQGNVEYLVRAVYQPKS